MHKPLGDKVDVGLTQPNRWTAYSLRQILLGLFRTNEASVLLAVILVSGGIAMVTPYFLTMDNLMGVFRSFSLTAIMSIGMVMVIITGGIDLSVGSVMGLSGLVTALAFQHGFSTVVSVSCGLGVGFLFGLTNGLLVTVGRLPPFIATLGTMSIGRGLMYIMTKGVPVTPETPDLFNSIGQGYVGSVPAPVIIMLVLALVFSVIMTFNTFGRHVYATGGNEQAAWLSGVNTSRVKLVVYTLSGTIAALAGIVAFSRYLSAEPASGLAKTSGREKCAVAGMQMSEQMPSVTAISTTGASPSTTSVMGRTVGPK